MIKEEKFTNNAKKEKRYLIISFENNLKSLREKKNLSQEDLAKKLRISRQSISKWEQGISYPSILYLVPLTKMLDCTLEELLKDLY